MSYRKRQSIEVRIFTGFFKALWWIITLPIRIIFGSSKKGEIQQNTSRDPEHVGRKWQEIKQLMEMKNPSSFARAVLEADKLLDHALKDLRVPGMTMGDRLKAARNKFSPEAYDAAWRAHRVRNELVHNSEFQVMDYTARETLQNYEKAIREIANI